MAQQYITLGATISGSSSIMDRKEVMEDLSHRWESMKAFVVIAEAYSPFTYSFYTYIGRFPADSIYTCLFLALVMGVPYMYMEFFIKQYTGKVDFTESLNPLLKALNYGVLLISFFHSLIHADDAAMLIFFLLSSLTFIPPWDDCGKVKDEFKENCISTYNITVVCEKQKNQRQNITLLSTSLYFKGQVTETDQTVSTKRIFLAAVSWILNFFICTIPEIILVKVFYLSFIIKFAASVIMLAYIALSATEHVSAALVETLNFSMAELDLTQIDYTHFYKFGIGVVTINDFGTMSPFTAIGNAIVLYIVVDTFLTFVRVVMLNIIKRVVNKCTEFQHHEYLFFVFSTIPLSANFFYCHRLILISIYTTMTVNTLTHLVAVTSTVSKMLRHDFKMIKDVYINGMLCLIGCMATVILMESGVDDDMLNTVQISMALLACLKTAIISYVYGVSKFSTDVYFWLGDQPSRYWRVTWALLPVSLAWITYLMAKQFHSSYKDNKEETVDVVVGIVTSCVIMLLVIVIEIRTLITFIVNNKLGSLFKASIKYGPPDSDDRRRRRRFDETQSDRACSHACNILDDKFVCDHEADLQRMLTSDEEVDALQNIFQAETGRKSRVSEMIDLNTS